MVGRGAITLALEKKCEGEHKGCGREGHHLLLWEVLKKALYLLRPFEVVVMRLKMLVVCLRHATASCEYQAPPCRNVKLFRGKLSVVVAMSDDHLTTELALLACRERLEGRSFGGVAPPSDGAAGQEGCGARVGPGHTLSLSHTHLRVMFSSFSTFSRLKPPMPSTYSTGACSSKNKSAVPLHFHTQLKQLGRVKLCIKSGGKLGIRVFYPVAGTF
eukprot:960099-Pelagomonas_calceolata.AAC.3